MKKRGYKISKKADDNFVSNLERVYGGVPFITKVYPVNKLYQMWHNDRYLKQCLYNLQEKYDCGGIPEREWKVIEDVFKDWM